MTPNEKTSDLSVSFPEDAYSGARYLKYIVDLYEKTCHEVSEKLNLIRIKVEKKKKI
ncbi:hypothetical protein HanIR_Chr12g0563001 [Helianthus annuus]|nr:hypothetical protein HanIR_Chr12g0563001 [Helianthus annuus]